MPATDAQAIDALLFDLDDTLLTHGRLTKDAYAALCDLADAGVELVACTGRPAGWGELLVRQWPLLGALAENGAVHITRSGSQVSSRIADGQSKQGLAPIVGTLRERFPSVPLADDNDARRSDVTFDIGERARIAPEVVDALRTAATELGARVWLSTVHLHVTASGYDKASGAFELLRQLRGWSPNECRRRALFIGDSENDATCFGAFVHTVGVANVAPWARRMSMPPRWICKAPMGAGFAELARRLLEARASSEKLP